MKVCQPQRLALWLAYFHFICRLLVSSSTAQYSMATGLSSLYDCVVAKAIYVDFVPS